ncbi:MAG TPA: SH3 domain-containing protein [Cyclobacteriaceae bacterium]|nr:SH3 domain-containing protein [Cyclobacteriaceae bacterium]HPW62834.1 SH3 domain-containing protein [Cyclobacteriaceae bacterium]
MKNIQTGFLKILLVTGAILCGSFAKANVASDQLGTADSLFLKKQYTQSFEIYQSLHQSGHYSPAMLLKMAFIQEGLGRTSLSLYYLNLYYLASGDIQVLDKLEELATKNRLEGYEHSESTRLFFNLKKYSYYLSAALAAIAIFLIAFLYRLRKKETRPVALGILTTIVTAILAIQVNISYDHPSAIVTDSTYLMSGPSAGANVVTLITEGHKLKITGKKDVWLKVEWLDKEAYVKENLVLPVVL